MFRQSMFDVFEVQYFGVHSKTSNYYNANVRIAANFSAPNKPSLSTRDSTYLLFFSEFIPKTVEMLVQNSQ